MNNMLEQWLGESLGVVEYLEREVGENHYAIQRALAEIRNREDEIERLERNIAIIRRATSDLEGSIDEAQFQREFDETFFTAEQLVEDDNRRFGERHPSEPAMEYLDEDEHTADSNVVHVMPAAAGARLPPPPPAAARLHR